MRMILQKEIEFQKKKKRRSFLQDSEGDLSSGRLMKLGAFLIAILLAVGGAAAIGIISYFNVDADVATLGIYLGAVVTAFLGVAAAAEHDQKKFGA
jgi:hypothetical protein